MKSSSPSRQSNEPVSELTTARLSVYLRSLEALEAAGVNTISSKDLADQFNLNAAQIRKDLAYFGEFGVRGVGYYVKDLRRHIREILGLNRQIKVIIMGAGNLGLALADYPGFRHDGFEIVALFDTAREKVGQYSRGGVVIRSMKDLERVVEREKVEIAAIAVPAERGPVRGRPGGRSGRARDPEFLARRAARAARREAEKRGPDRVARKPVLLSRTGSR